MAKKLITKDEWEKKLAHIKVRKEDMNKLIMNYFVTEGYVDAAEKFQLETGTERILFYKENVLKTVTIYLGPFMSSTLFFPY